ncbi:hypothetical protein [Streptomyces bobili]|uniref:Uncharacterized protein n=1 Tax=Streptomyces bobili TaxID=67280 RepID=A0ABZ1QQD2_9ACTN|nr:hypothetical protein [Streptomyces bobili]
MEIVTRMSHRRRPRSPRRRRGEGEDAPGKSAGRLADRASARGPRRRQAEQHLGDADELLADGLGQDVPGWVAYFDVVEHAGPRAVSARDLAELGRPRKRASTHFEDALKLRKPGFDRVRVMDRVGLAAALFDEGEAERGAAAAQQALDDAARV